ESTARDEKGEALKGHKQGGAELLESDKKRVSSKARKQGRAATKSESADIRETGASTKATTQPRVTTKTASTKGTTQAEATAKSASAESAKKVFGKWR
ncbi:unnamed protein product, partial [Rotaria magnacalcarata]